MRAVAQAADVSRSTLYRHFDDATELQRAVQRQALAEVAAAIERSLADGKPPLAELRSVVAALVEVGAAFPLQGPIGPPPERALAEAADRLRPLAERLAEAAGLDLPPTGRWLDAAIAHLVETCVRAGSTDARERDATVERLLGVITDPLDRGLLLLEADGTVVALNRDARDALADADTVQPGRRAVIRRGGLYEDGLPLQRKPTLSPLPWRAAKRTRASEDGRPATATCAGT